MPIKKHQTRCSICHNLFKADDLIPGIMVRDPIAELIRLDLPDWKENNYICRQDLSRYRTAYVQNLLKMEKGELTLLENGVLESLKKQELLAHNVDAEFEKEWSFGEKLADRIAVFGGSWRFLILFGIFLVFWIVLNTLILMQHPLDPYPYILLNLVLSCLASIQAPIIMMSQNRQEAKDRLRSQNDYQVNLKAELEIRQLHEKIDHLLSHQWERLAQIQEIQIDLLAELRRWK